MLVGGEHPSWQDRRRDLRQSLCSSLSFLACNEKKKLCLLSLAIGFSDSNPPENDRFSHVDHQRFTSKMNPVEKRRDKRKHEDYVDWLGFSCDSDYGIPRLCPCGGDITEEVLEMEPLDTLPGKRWFSCKKFKAGGGHIRVPWVYSMSEEIERLIKRVEEAERVVHSSADMMKKMEALEEEVKFLRDQVANLSGQVSLLERINYSSD